MSNTNLKVVEAGGQCGDCNTCAKQCNNSEQLAKTREGQNFYTIIIYSENFAGILNQITAVFTRRQINIESLNVCASSTPGVHKYTVTCWCSPEIVVLLTKQIEKKIDVLKASYFTDDQIFFIESCLVKISTPMALENPQISKIIRRNGASIVEMNATYSIVERKGKSHTITELYESLNELGAVIQFVRSGRIAVTRSHIEMLDRYLSERASEINSEE